MIRSSLHLLLTLFSLQFLFAQGHVTLEISDIRFDEVRFAGFKLDRTRTIEIEAIGGGFEKAAKQLDNDYYDRHDMFVYAWILDAKSRDLVWRMTIGNTESSDEGEFIREFDNEIELPPGRYEAYFFAKRPNRAIFGQSGIPSLREFFRRLFQEKNWVEIFKELSFLKISGIDEVYSKAEIRQYHRKIHPPALTLTQMRNNDAREKRFTLTEDGVFEVYALGEVLDGDEYDYGWIVNEDTGERIWSMRQQHSNYAGGANKNHYWKSILNLKAGNYSVHYVTDDSHSPERWNANPPYDPYFWGISLYGVPGKYSSKMMKEYEKPEAVKLLSINEVGNHHYEKKGFILTEKTAMRVIAIGEGSRHRMSDFGWIENARTGRIIWEMKYHKTDHAGGAAKNRKAEDTLVLNPGEYYLVYSSDGSHAYNSWNNTQPYNASDWGITLYPLDANFDPKSVRLFDKEFVEPALEITQVRDDEFRQKHFKVERTTRFRVFAIGEGTHYLVDYGWIEEVRTGRVVWKMRYRRTVHAGGAKKNRKIDEVIELDAGDYVLNYQTDDSHAYGDWNASPPYDQQKWGISLYQLDSGESTIQPLSRAPSDLPRPFLSLTRIMDDELVSKRFTLEEESDIRVLSIGEGSNGEMYDYGWITNAANGRRIWEMKYRDTDHAGGASKNRVVNEVISLPAGEYVAYYRTDDSHSYKHWNSSEPRRPELWGISLSAVTIDPSEIKVYDDAKSSQEAICKLVEINDDEHSKRTFRISNPTVVRIYAIGEGDDGEMYDYGWLEHRNTREVIWVMEYDETSWAGGAHKNRTASITLTLQPGQYTLHYVTDDSHSFGDWNSSPPKDQRNYGITVSKLK